MDSKEIDQLMQEYKTLREQLRELTINQIKESDDYKRLLRVQGRLVISEVDLNSGGGLAQKIRETIRPHDSELKKYPFLYSELAMYRDIRKTDYLYGRQK